MESSTAAPEIETNETTEVEPEQPTNEIFKYSDWIHLGVGAKECEKREEFCENPAHFHAWIRLPNKFQITELREKAQAARARVIRQAKDPESDRSAIIDNQLDELRHEGKEAMIEELMARNNLKWSQQARREVAEGEDDDEESPYAHIQDDYSRFQELYNSNPEDRNEDEFQELMKHLETWDRAVEEKLNELRAPELNSLNDRDEDELLAMVRDQVVSEQADQVFMRVFSKEQYTLCTQTLNRNGRFEPKFPNSEALGAAAPEEVEALEEGYKELESAMANQTSLRAEGNS